MEDCIFCKIINKEMNSSIVYEDDISIVIMDAFPANPGHLLVLPKKHIVDITEIDDETGAHLFKTVIKAETGLRKAFPDIQSTNIVQNNGWDAGQRVFHSHIHIIPRFKDDNRLSFYNPGKMEDLSVLNNISQKIKNKL